ncbi:MULTISPECIES: TIGR04190 family B12-binding domain/radical SAM domain protein [unclassified Candidatus Frackibacter]|uniref:TIGR04190 family B12-binding domain/radical SAM domain protein n=1 Tax=unclassified Candidatus Frackibacter TaxID=2648818 RepID=UPI000889E978|nr:MULTISPECIES: TIGR04190 family B12-binding domain/radical SAM domain protein [unclassified Candidatus Frackibacter]SDC80476.1 B12-binding domain/radical SAM domain protein, Ta0216 family [Candidatus Frackibacter sp. WG11]SEM92962.1 B12-binding domain/radical SAM domain protein, Ta0216 family [Candidatus Frackibacter sp. WG12]SFM02944.1 B12-binding domain/radical SAM domain protein, Ta0216 family [Candidatus Frackibacter sp. WG13]
MSKVDLVLLHPPSVYDFRKKSIFYGPVSDLIPSSPVFEMYPLGFLTIQSYLEEQGYKVRIVNLAVRMMKDENFDAREFISKLDPKAFGIDLHWLPHAHGSLEVAKIVKEEHPDTPVIFGGLSSTYFHEELVDYQQVDYVLRGDCTEVPFLKLLKNIENNNTDKDSLEKVPNLTWQDEEQTIINKLDFNPDSLDYVDLRPEIMIKNVFRYHDLESILPFDGWLNNPITTVFSVKGCKQGCITCGRSVCTNEHYNKRQGPIFRSPASMVKNMKKIAQFSRGPIFIVGDIRQAGGGYVSEFLNRLNKANLKNEIVFELFSPASGKFLKKIDESVQNWSLELSPESHSEVVRKAQDRTIFYTNEEMERTLDIATELGCNRIDVFFMIGLPRQTPKSVQETIDYCEYLFEKYDERLSCFISPMGPFLDPGSLAFEHPEKMGYKKLAHTLDDHRKQLTNSSWEEILSYETDWMTRKEIVEQTYSAAERLNKLKHKYDRIDDQTNENITNRISQAKKLKELLEKKDEELDFVEHLKLRGEIDKYSISTVCDKTELDWPVKFIKFKLSGIFKMLLA